MRRVWTARIVTAFLVWLAGCAVAYWRGNQPRPGLLALLVAAVAATLWLFLDASLTTVPASWSRPDREPGRLPGEDPRLAMLTRLVGAHLDAREVGPGLQQELATLADQRLLAHYGVSLKADPVRASALLGPELAAYVAGDGGHARLTPERIALLLDRVEAL